MCGYKIKLAVAKDGKHNYSFEVKDKFFEIFDYSLLEKADIITRIQLEKNCNKFILSVSIEGEIHGLNCDLCADSLTVPITAETTFIIKESVEQLESTDDIIYVQPKQSELEIRHLIYELIILALPVKRRHKSDASGNIKCNKKTLALVNQYSKKEYISDPRWDALKKIKIEKTE
jgi:uncharacterized metal-binding protein YceD (DUF177 family)